VAIKGICIESVISLPSYQNGRITQYRDTPEIPALGRLRQKDLKFDNNLGYIVRSCLEN
jgi:hypothetical protein